jgi:hypothetical protein
VRNYNQQKEPIVLMESLALSSHELAEAVLKLAEDVNVQNDNRQKELMCFIKSQAASNSEQYIEAHKTVRIIVDACTSSNA